jgi:hypothetical protein
MFSDNKAPRFGQVSKACPGLGTLACQDLLGTANAPPMETREDAAAAPMILAWQTLL